MENTVKRAVIYTRMSSEEQAEGYSLDEQERMVRRMCEFKGWEVVQVYSDTNLNDQIVKRPGFQAMIDDAEAGMFDIIAVHELDRFSRSLIDAVLYLMRLDKNEVAFICIAGEFDTTTVIGKKFLYMMNSFVEWHINNLAIETQENLFASAMPDEWMPAMNVVLKALQHKANDTTTEADDEILELVDRAIKTPA